MGSVSLPTAGLVYLDTNCLLYRVEKVPHLSTLLDPVFAAAASGAVSLVTSELSHLECLVKPRREGAGELEALFRSVLSGSRELRMLPVSMAVLEEALRLRAEFGLKTPDAIHAATALTSGCSAFLSNDDGFRRVPNLRVVVLSELA